MSRNVTDAEVNEGYESFWKELVETDGVLDLEKVKAELFDYRTAMSEVGKAYDELTGGRFTKPNTDSVYVIEAAQKHFDELSR